MSTPDRPDRHLPPERLTGTDLELFEKRLADVPVDPLVMDRDRLMFESGRAAGIASEQRRRTLGRWAWPAATAASTAAAVLLATVLIGSSQPAQQAAVEGIESDTQAATATTPTKNAPTHRLVAENGGRDHRFGRGYLADRHRALTRGIGALADRRRETVADTRPLKPAPTMRDLLKELTSDSTS